MRGGMKMVNAHIIPRSFFELVRGKGKHSVGIVIDKDTYSTPFLQAGPSDESILGNCCEPKFSEWDDYGFKILGKKWDTKDVISSSDGTTPMAFELNALDYDKLSLSSCFLFFGERPSPATGSSKTYRWVRNSKSVCDSCC
jgi:hypothetical protein